LPLRQGLNFFLHYHVSDGINLLQQSIFGIELKKFYEGLKIFLNLEESYLNIQNFHTEK
jgi:hypothetical protein